MDSRCTFAYGDELGAGMGEHSAISESEEMEGPKLLEDMRGNGKAASSGSVSVSVSEVGFETETGFAVRRNRRTDSRPSSFSLKWTFFGPNAGVEGIDSARA
jgi:hypothetical protein